MARPIFWAVLIYCLFVWAGTTGFAPMQSALTTATVVVAGLVQLAEQQRHTTEQRIREALRLSDLSITKAALHMNLDPSDFEKGLRGERKLDLWRLEMLPEEFSKHYATLTLIDKGVPTYFRKALKMVFLPLEGGVA